MPASPKHKSRNQISDDHKPHKEHVESSQVLEAVTQNAGLSPRKSEESQNIQEASPTSGSAKKRHHSKSNGPRLNTWDVPEFLPGAMPGATAVQREYFQERSIKVFRNEQRMQKRDEQESMRREHERHAEKLAHDIAHLHELFPSIDVDVIQETYLLADSDVDATINQLLIIAEGTSTGNTPRSEKKGPPSSEDEKEFPGLTDKDGWELVRPEIEMRIEDAGDTGKEARQRYKDRLMSSQKGPDGES